MSGATGRRSVEEQLAVVLDAVHVLEAETRAVQDAAGRTLADPAVAAHDIPLFDNSAMDGFAVRGADVEAASSANPVTLRVVADLPAGVSLDPPLGPGEAARIMTGSPSPADARTRPASRVPAEPCLLYTSPSPRDS